MKHGNSRSDDAGFVWFCGFGFVMMLVQCCERKNSSYLVRVKHEVTRSGLIETILSVGVC